jgi:hypothetical protein
MENPCSLAVNETKWWYKTNQGWVWAAPSKQTFSAGEPSAVNIVIFPVYGAVIFLFPTGIVVRESGVSA